MIPNTKYFRKAMQLLRPNAEWTLQGSVFEAIDVDGTITHPNFTWLSLDQTIPSEQEIQSEIDRLEREWEASQYGRSRAQEYPSIGDQLDDLFHAGMFSEEMAAKIQAVKDKYPKG